MKHQIKNFAKSAIGFTHRAALKAGVVVLPNHYYTPVADAHELRRSRASWARRSLMLGIDVNVDGQIATLRSMVKQYEPEVRGNATYLEGQSKGFGPGFGYIEAQCFPASCDR